MISECGFEAEHRGSAYRLSREQSPSLRGGVLSPSRVPASDAGIHCTAIREVSFHPERRCLPSPNLT